MQPQNYTPEQLQRAIARRYRLLGMLSGRGIEIGALHQAMPVPHLRIRYVDCIPLAVQREHYAELGATPLAPVDILDDGQTLATLPDAAEDFVIANHIIEHMRDPITALENWHRVLRVGGRLMMAVPDKEQTYDSTRPLTSIEHLVLDREQPSKERDYEAFREFARESLAGKANLEATGKSEELARHMWNVNYSIHYHVWNQPSFDAFLAFVRSYLPHWRMQVVERCASETGEFIYLFERE
ncbi:MAG: methyltransferase domain-containing protein [Planctomycetota bacterium]